MKLLKRIASLYSPSYPTALVYMAQSSEYRIKDYLVWYLELPNFNEIQKRGQIKTTKVAKLLLLFARAGIYLQYLLSFAVIVQDQPGALNIGTFIIISAPIIWAYLLCIPMLLGRITIIEPAEKKLLTEAKKIFKKHKGTKIAVLGSYGKTSMKELLKTVLESDLNVAATPANLNVPTSVAKFAKSLDGDEDVLIVEFGEEKPGDIAMFADLVDPDIAVITGVAPAHLSHYKTIQAINDDLLAIANYVDEDKILFNADSPMLQAHIGSKFRGYSSIGIDKWKVDKVKLSHDKTKFTLTNARKKIEVETGLLGRHNIGPITAAVAIAEEAGLKPKQIEAAVAETLPFEHRMQSRKLNGAWLIDDTYNGNLEGIKAGLALLTELKAKRKIYVTPGLVDQGQENETVHTEIGRLIALAQPDLVVLMQNTATKYIRAGLDKAGYLGELRLEDEPLNFYANIEHVIAKGDLVLMQNDWPDFYR